MPEPTDPSFRPLRADQRHGGAPPQPPKRRRSFARVAGGTVVRGIYRLAVLGVIAAVLLGGGLFFYFSNGLPSIAGLKHYQPPLMTRVYASDFQLIGELGTQRRI